MSSLIVKADNSKLQKKIFFCRHHKTLITLTCGTMCRSWDNLYTSRSKCIFRLAQFITGLGIVILN